MCGLSLPLLSVAIYIERLNPPLLIKIPQSCPSYSYSAGSHLIIFLTGWIASFLEQIWWPFGAAAMEDDIGELGQDVPRLPDV